MDHTHTRLARSHPYIGRAESPAGLHWGERAGGRPWVVTTPVITPPPRGGGARLCPVRQRRAPQRPLTLPGRQSQRPTAHTRPGHASEAASPSRPCHPQPSQPRLQQWQLARGHAHLRGGVRGYRRPHTASVDGPRTMITPVGPSRPDAETRVVGGGWASPTSSVRSKPCPLCRSRGSASRRTYRRLLRSSTRRGPRRPLRRVGSHPSPPHPEGTPEGIPPGGRGEEGRHCPGWGSEPSSGLRVRHQ